MPVDAPSLAVVLALIALVVSVQALRGRGEPTTIVLRSDGQVERGMIRVLAFGKEKLREAMNDGLSLAFVPFGNDPEALRGVLSGLELDKGRIYEVVIVESTDPLG